MTREQFLARCGTAYDMGLCTPDRLKLLDGWLDAVMRFEGGQLDRFTVFLEFEALRTGGFAGNKTLASDADGYALIQLAAVLTHPCQKCAEDPNAWHTRMAFCQHKRDKA